MKAILQTLCGCSRMIDISDLKPCINLPLQQISAYDSTPNVPKIIPMHIRRFNYLRQEIIMNKAIAIYQEEIE